MGHTRRQPGSMMPVYLPKVNLTPRSYWFICRMLEMTIRSATPRSISGKLMAPVYPMRCELRYLTGYTRTADFVHDVAREEVASFFLGEDVRGCIARPARFLCRGKWREALSEEPRAQAGQHVARAGFYEAFVRVDGEGSRAREDPRRKSFFNDDVCLEEFLDVVIFREQFPFSSVRCQDRVLHLIVPQNLQSICIHDLLDRVAHERAHQGCCTGSKRRAIAHDEDICGLHLFLYHALMRSRKMCPFQFFCHEVRGKGIDGPRHSFGRHDDNRFRSRAQCRNCRQIGGSCEFLGPPNHKDARPSVERGSAEASRLNVLHSSYGEFIAIVRGKSTFLLRSRGCSGYRQARRRRARAAAGRPSRRRIAGTARRPPQA